MTPEVVVSDIVNEQRKDERHRDKLCLVANGNHHNHGQSKDNVDELCVKKVNLDRETITDNCYLRFAS